MAFNRTRITRRNTDWFLFLWDKVGMARCAVLHRVQRAQQMLARARFFPSAASRGGDSAARCPYLFGAPPGRLLPLSVRNERGRGPRRGVCLLSPTLTSVGFYMFLQKMGDTRRLCRFRCR